MSCCLRRHLMLGCLRQTGQYSCKCRPRRQPAGAGYGEERYENIKFQEQVAQQYNALVQQDPSSWSILDANQDTDTLSHEVTAWSACLV